MASLDELAAVRDEARAKSEIAAKEAVEAAVAAWMQWAADTPRKIVTGQAAMTDSLSDHVLGDLKAQLRRSVDPMADALAATLEDALRYYHDISNVKNWYFEDWWSPFGEALQSHCEEFLKPIWALGFYERHWDAPRSLYPSYADGAQTAAKLSCEAFRAYADCDDAYRAQVETEQRERSESRFDGL
jgi:hypothetical protein